MVITNNSCKGENTEQIKCNKLQPKALSAKCTSDITYIHSPPDVPCNGVQGNCRLHNNQCVIIDRHLCATNPVTDFTSVWPTPMTNFSSVWSIPVTNFSSTWPTPITTFSSVWPTHVTNFSSTWPTLVCDRLLQYMTNTIVNISSVWYRAISIRAIGDHVTYIKLFGSNQCANKNNLVLTTTTIVLL